MMSSINISLNEVNDLSNEIKRINTNILDILNYAKQEMMSLSNDWQSSGSEMIRNRFQYFSNKFIEQKDVIDSYARFLDYTVASYDSLETTITKNASSIS